MQIRHAMLTHVGRVRARNEDACGADPDTGVFVVCDGMGGAAGGAIASREAASTFLDHFHAGPTGTDLETALRAALNEANRTIYERAGREPRLRGMGTTLVALHLDLEQRSAMVAHVGDSRCYRLRRGAFERLTEDHSIVEEQVRSGEITEAQARRSHLRNVITRVVGTNASVLPDVQHVRCEPDDLFLLCSDGLNRDLTDSDLKGILERHSHDLDRAASLLVDAANLLGGGDNITVVLVQMCGTSSSADDAEQTNEGDSIEVLAD